MAVDPEVLLGEIAQLQSRDIDTGRLKVSDRAQVVMPWHRLIDRLDEDLRGAGAIGHDGQGHRPLLHRQGGAGAASASPTFSNATT